MAYEVKIWMFVSKHKYDNNVAIYRKYILLMPQLARA